MDGELAGREVEVLRWQALQTTRGEVATYLYTLRLPNGAIIKLAEEHLAPTAERKDDTESEAQ